MHSVTRKPLTRQRAIDANCRACVYDPAAAGTWRQQVTLCAVTSCALYPFRPTTKAKIPERVLRYYGVMPRHDPQNGSSADLSSERNTKVPGRGYSPGEDAVQAHDGGSS